MIERNQRETQPSDHAPVLINLDIDNQMKITSIMIMIFSKYNSENLNLYKASKRFILKKIEITHFISNFLKLNLQILLTQ